MEVERWRNDIGRRRKAIDLELREVYGQVSSSVKSDKGRIDKLITDIIGLDEPLNKFLLPRATTCCLTPEASSRRDSGRACLPISQVAARNSGVARSARETRWRWPRTRRGADGLHGVEPNPWQWSRPETPGS